MADLERMTIVMPPKMAAEIKAAVESGDYATSSEVIREALRDWRDHREFTAQRKAREDARLRAAWDSGIASLAEHGGIPWEEVEAELDAIIEEAQHKQSSNAKQVDKEIVPA